MFETLRSDMRAQEGTWTSPSFWVLAVYRFGVWRYRVRPVIVRKMFSLAYKILNRVVQVLSGMELPCEAVVGRDFVIDHSFGIVISGDARFGDHCRIRTGAVVGLNRVDQPGSPTIGNHVDIGAGAKLLGPITIGDNVLIGANAVVLCDVPSNCIAVGVPAVVKPRKRVSVEKQPPALRVCP
jgi:serine O-acetyltransferase